MACLFCDFVSGHQHCHRIWEDDAHLAFLSIFPNTEGVTVVIPKKHHPSDVFDLPDVILGHLLRATRTVARLLESKLTDVGRIGLIFEGFAIDHVHAKLYPMHGTAQLANWKPLETKRDQYFHQYPGYLSSHDAQQAEPATLEALAQKIRG